MCVSESLCYVSCGFLYLDNEGRIQEDKAQDIEELK